MLVKQFDQYILMDIPLPGRMVVLIVRYWLIGILPLIITIRHGGSLIPRKHIVAQIVTGVGIGAFMSTVFTLTPTLLGLGDWVDNGHHYTELWQFIYEFVYCIVAVGLVEEFIFRGFVFGKLIELGSSENVAITASSLLFGFFHFLGGNVVQIIVTTFLGAFFCLCRKKVPYCSLLSLVIAHGIYDALITVWASVL